MPLEKLTDRQLNRATLARQMLLERSDIGVAEATARLLGLQAQVTEGPYQGLWSRLNGFRHQDLTALIVDRTLARATTMRSTLHLHTADDLLGIRPIVEPQLQATWRSGFRKRFGDTDETAVLREARKLLDAEPMTAGKLGKLLHEKFPTAEPLATTTLLQVHETLVQIPPTRIWGSGHAPILTRVEKWLPEPHKRPLSREMLVRRYLAAYGPASINDMQSWGKLTKLSVEFKRLERELVQLEAPDGRMLYDLQNAPRPDVDTPAPVRFLPLYDNVYLGYDNRRRILEEGDMKRINLFADFKPAVLIDGTISAGWTIEVKKGAAVLEVEPYHNLSKAQVREVEEEGAAFLRFMQETSDTYDVRVTPMREA